MFIPLHDANSLKHIKLQYVTVSLIGINIPSGWSSAHCRASSRRALWCWG